MALGRQRDRGGGFWRALLAYKHQKGEGRRVIYRSKEISQNSSDATFRELISCELLRLFRFQKGEFIKWFLLLDGRSNTVKPEETDNSLAPYSLLAFCV